MYIAIIFLVTFSMKQVVCLPSDTVQSNLTIWMKLDVDYSADSISNWMKIQLFYDYMPKTVVNFASLCMDNVTYKGKISFNMYNSILISYK